jgi:Skp family chaperone for outer membrane proteins
MNMSKYVVAITMIMLPVLVHAQQGPAAMNEIQLRYALSAMSQDSAALASMNGNLQQQLAKEQAEVKRLTDKYEPKKPAADGK